MVTQKYVWVLGVQTLLLMTRTMMELMLALALVALGDGGGASEEELSRQVRARDMAY